VFASTPRGKNLFYTVHRQSQTDKDWYSLTLKASESGIIPEEELNSLRKDMDPEEFAQEYECSFDAALKGAIYAEEVNALFYEQRVKPELYDPNLPTHVVFDLGFTDSTVAIYWQEAKDGTLRVVNVEATQGKDIFHHIDRVASFSSLNELGQVWLPHDARAKNLQTGRSVVEQFLENDIRPQIVPNHKVRDRIAATRRLFPRIHLDETPCTDLIEALKGYRREWDDNLLRFSDQPLHDWCSDYADAFGYMCVVAAPKFAVSSPAEAMRAQQSPLSQSHYNLETLFQDNEARRRATAQRIA
jgi:hypothetical protein